MRENNHQNAGKVSVTNIFLVAWASESPVCFMNSENNIKKCFIKKQNKRFGSSDCHSSSRILHNSHNLARPLNLTNTQIDNNGVERVFYHEP